jgi:hypothetical protein
MEGETSEIRQKNVIKMGKMEEEGGVMQAEWRIL